MQKESSLINTLQGQSANWNKATQGDQFLTRQFPFTTISNPLHQARADNSVASTHETYFVYLFQTHWNISSFNPWNLLHLLISDPLKYPIHKWLTVTCYNNNLQLTQNLLKGLRTITTTFYLLQNNFNNFSISNPTTFFHDIVALNYAKGNNQLPVQNKSTSIF